MLTTSAIDWRSGRSKYSTAAAIARKAKMRVGNMPKPPALKNSPMEKLLVADRAGLDALRGQKEGTAAGKRFGRFGFSSGLSAVLRERGVQITLGHARIG